MLPRRTLRATSRTAKKPTNSFVNPWVSRIRSVTRFSQPCCAIDGTQRLPAWGARRTACHRYRIAPSSERSGLLGRLEPPARLDHPDNPSQVCKSDPCQTDIASPLIQEAQCRVVFRQDKSIDNSTNLIARQHDLEAGLLKERSSRLNRCIAGRGLPHEFDQLRKGASSPFRYLAKPSTFESPPSPTCSAEPSIFEFEEQ